MWIWQHPDWPNFVVDASEFSGRVEAFHRAAERLSGQVDALSDTNQTEASVDLMLSEVLASYAIEGGTLDRDSVRSSLLAHFGRSTRYDLSCPGQSAVARDVGRSRVR